MDFSIYISTLAKTWESDPEITPLRLSRGRLTGGFLFFPPGPAGVLHFQARIGKLQIIPFTPGESYQLDDCVIPFSLGIDLFEPPFQIDCITWNTSVLYPHILTACFFLDPSAKKKFAFNTIKNAFSSTKGYSKP